MKGGEKMNILEEANKITSHDRNSQYDEPEDNFARIWEYNKAYLINKAKGRNLIPELECQLLSFIGSLGLEYIARQGLFIKLGREDFKHKRDNLVDLVGYARCLSKIEGDENAKE